MPDQLQDRVVHNFIDEGSVFDEPNSVRECRRFTLCWACLTIIYLDTKRTISTWYACMMSAQSLFMSQKTKRVFFTSLILYNPCHMPPNCLCPVTADLMQKRDENMCMCIVNTGGTGPAYVRGMGAQKKMLT